MSRPRGYLTQLFLDESPELCMAAASEFGRSKAGVGRRETGAPWTPSRQGCHSS